MIDCLSSSPCLWTSIECAYCVAIILICWNVFFSFIRGSLSIVSRFFIDEMCVVALAPATNTMSGATFHFLVIMLMMRRCRARNSLICKSNVEWFESRV